MRGASKLRRVGIFAITLMVVTSMVAPSAMAATSAPDEDPCNPGLLDTKGFYNLLGIQTEECTAEQIGTVTQESLASSALALDDLEKAAVVPISNQIETRTVVRASAKATAVKEFKNGSSLAEAKDAVNQTVDQYYTRIQLNLFETHRANANQLVYIHDAQNTTSGVTSDTLQSWDGYNASVGPIYPTTTNDQSYGTGSKYRLVTTKVNVTLVNGSTRNIVALEKQYISSGATKAILEPTLQHGGSSADAQFVNYYVIDPAYAGTTPSTLNDTNANLAYQHGRFVDVNQKIETNHDGVKQNVLNYTDSLYSTYNNSSDLAISEVLDPLTLAQEFNTNYNSTGAYGWLAAEYGLTDVNGTVNESFAIEYTPATNHTQTQSLSINGTGNVTYRYNANETYNLSGTFYTDWAPNKTNGDFKVTETYDTANATSPVVFITQLNNSSTIVELNGTFTITELTNVRTGESINSTTLEQQTISTWNASSTEKTLQRYIDYRNNVTENYGSSGGGGSGGFNFDFGSAGIGFIVIAGGAALLLLNRP